MTDAEGEGGKNGDFWMTSFVNDPLRKDFTQIFKTTIINEQQLCSCCLRNENLSVVADKNLFSESQTLKIFELYKLL